MKHNMRGHFERRNFGEEVEAVGKDCWWWNVVALVYRAFVYLCL